eukprot:GFYU01004227.1.p1 GENE.GFYU01004227.1~~GFYU01004227.1.p1  ORF type:complete len:368 (-),score=123.74 GFYU01004227.1:22-1125(-)
MSAPAVTSQDSEAPPAITFPEQVFDLCFHPSADVVAAGLITGQVGMFQYGEVGNTCLYSFDNHRESCRATAFSPSGSFLITSSSDKSIAAIDVHSGNLVKKMDKAHDNPINSMLTFGEHFMASGDDEGCVKLWDFRQQNCVLNFKENEDFISDMVVNNEQTTLLTPSGDGTLAVLDLRKGKLLAASDNMEDELLSVVLLKHEQRAVIGSQDGLLSVWKYGDWGDMKDRYPGHPQSIDTIVKLDENTILTGSSDGLIRIVQIQPNRLLGLLGDHDDFPVERLGVSRDGLLVGSCSHDCTVKFWHIGYLREEGALDIDDEDMEEDSDDDSDDMDTGNKQKKQPKKKKDKGKAKDQTKEQAQMQNFFAGL